MAHHKRRRPKKRRAGCLFCKHHKHNGSKHKLEAKHKRKVQESVYKLRDAG